MIKLNPLHGSRSLTRDFSLGFLIIIIVISILVFSISGLIFNKIEGNKFRKEAQSAYQDFKELIITPLWHYDDAEITAICKTFLSGGMASKIVIYSEDNRQAYAFAGKAGNKPGVDFFSDDLLFNTKHIGRVEFYLKEPIYSEHSRFFFYTTISAISIICISIAAATWLLLRLYVNRPLGELLNWILKIEQGDYTNAGIVFPQNEIQAVVRRFSQMVDSIRNREYSIRESENRYRTLFESANDAIIIIKDSRFIDCNPKTLEMFGCEREQIIGRNPFTFSPSIQPDGQESKEKGFEKIESALKGEPQSFEWQHSRLDGTLFDAEVSLNPTEIGSDLYLQAIVRDITDRKKAEEDLQRLSTAIEHATEDITITDPDGIIQYVNPAFEKVTGYTKVEAIGQDLGFLKSGYHDSEFYEEMWTKLKNGQVWTGLLTNKRKDGGFIKQEANISPILSSSNQILGYVSVKRDITEQEKMKTQLQQAQRMEAIGTLAGGIAHDFNNILSAIIGNAEIAATHELPKEHPALYSIEQVIMAAERASSLVKQILAFSRQSEQEFDRISVTPIIKEVSKLLRASLPSTIDIRLDLKAEKDMIVSEPARVHQILMNLCTNAAHAMRKNGGVLSIKTTELELDPDSISNYPDLEPGSYLELTIQDTGPGMSPEVMERIFEPYFTTKQKGEGTGLGLAVIHGIVNSLKGTITVNSTLNKGSSFIVRLPVLSGKPLIKGGEKAPLTRGNEKILLVDDEEQLTGLGKRMLQRLGYTVFTENSSTEALKIFRNDPYGFDIIITDMTMPNMTGDKLAIAMMNIRPDIPIILCTGFSESITGEQAKEIGIREFIMKPMVLSDLSEKIRRVLGD